MKLIISLRALIGDFYKSKYILLAYLVAISIFFYCLGFSRWTIVCVVFVGYFHLITAAYIDGDIFPANFVYVPCPDKPKELVQLIFELLSYGVHVALVLTVIVQIVLRYQ